MITIVGFYSVLHFFLFHGSIIWYKNIFILEYRETAQQFKIIIPLIEELNWFTAPMYELVTMYNSISKDIKPSSELPNLLDEYGEHIYTKAYMHIHLNQNKYFPNILYKYVI